MINRFIQVNNKKLKKYEKSGIFFERNQTTAISASINIYNQGCPAEKWNIEPELISNNSFKVFSTGDAFSVISPKIAISGADINIHVGLEHKNYSPLVLIQEALQLCRCAYEHGAKSITVALPDQLHPIAHYSDFNTLLIRLFKASGAKNIFFYDKNYAGKLDEKCALTDIQVDRQTLQDYLSQPSNDETDNLDSHIMHLMRENKFKRTWSKFNGKNKEAIEYLVGNHSTSPIHITEMKNQPHVLLYCSTNRPLAEKIAARLRDRGEEVAIHAIEGRAEKASIPDIANICNAEVTIVQSTRPNPDNHDDSKDYQTNGASSYLFEAASVAWQANLRGAKNINLINPYQFSARSDKAEDNPKGKAGSYVQLNGLLLAAAGVNHIITAECHDTHTLSGTYTGKTIKSTGIPALSVISARLANEWLSDPDHPLQGQLRLVTPDAGAAKRTKELTETLQTILGTKLCKTRVVGEKQRDSHEDISALITGFNSGDVNMNPNDKYLITDDETATGSTLCQSITSIKKLGAQSISVIVVHNNMPLDWLTRQMCLARFFYLGASDLHFSDTQVMGTLANDYKDLVNSYSQQLKLSHSDVEKMVFAWFKENISKHASDRSEASVECEFKQFKDIFNQLKSKVRVHSLADEFASKVIVNDAHQHVNCSTFYKNNSSLPLFSNSNRKVDVDLAQSVNAPQNAS